MDLDDWLERHGLTRYKGLFAKHAIGLDVLPQLTDQELKALKIPLGDRKRLLMATVELSVAVAPAPQPAVAPTGSRESDTDAPPAVVTPEVGERRQLTVMFCDLVGFTELASRVDPEVLQQIIRSYEDACAACVTRY
ncbi:MAG: hypothetical protein ACREVT_06710, partial [Burkholderiales bacterium]